MSETEKRIEKLKDRKEALVGEYKRLMIILSGMQDQIADVEGDIRMLESGQKKESS